MTPLQLPRLMSGQEIKYATLPEVNGQTTTYIGIFNGNLTSAYAAVKQPDNSITTYEVPIDGPIIHYQNEFAKANNWLHNPRFVNTFDPSKLSHDSNGNPVLDLESLL